MDKKEINFPKLTEHFLFWVCGIGGHSLRAGIADTAAVVELIAL
jgi:hypothetical protein